MNIVNRYGFEKLIFRNTHRIFGWVSINDLTREHWCNLYSRQLKWSPFFHFSFYANSIIISFWWISDNVFALILWTHILSLDWLNIVFFENLCSSFLGLNTMIYLCSKNSTNVSISKLLLGLKIFYFLLL